MPNFDDIDELELDSERTEDELLHKEMSALGDTIKRNQKRAGRPKKSQSSVSAETRNNKILRQYPDSPIEKLEPYESEHLFYQVQDFTALTDYSDFTKLPSTNENEFYQQNSRAIFDRFNRHLHRVKKGQEFLIRSIIENNPSLGHAAQVFDYIQQKVQYIAERDEEKLQTCAEDQKPSIEKEIQLCERIKEEFDRQAATALVNGQIILADNVVKFLQPAPIAAQHLVEKKTEFDIAQSNGKKAAKYALSESEQQELKLYQLQNNVIRWRQSLARIEPVIDQFISQNPNTSKASIRLFEADNTAGNEHISAGSLDDIIYDADGAPSHKSKKNRFTKGDANTDIEKEPQTIAEFSAYISAILESPKLRKRFDEDKADLPLQFNSEADSDKLGSFVANHQQDALKKAVKKTIGLYLYAKQFLNDGKTENEYKEDLSRCLADIAGYKSQNKHDNITPRQVGAALGHILPHEIPSNIFSVLIEEEIDKMPKISKGKEYKYIDFIRAIIPDLNSDSTALARLKLQAREVLIELIPSILTENQVGKKSSKKTAEEQPENQLTDAQQITANTSLIKHSTEFKKDAYRY